MAAQVYEALIGSTYTPMQARTHLRGRRFCSLISVGDSLVYKMTRWYVKCLISSFLLMGVNISTCLISCQFTLRWMRRLMQAPTQETSYVAQLSLNYAFDNH